MPSRVSLPLAKEARPEQVILSEPMKRYRCNQKGCCCRGWEIPFKLDDFLRLFDHLPPEEQELLGDGLRLTVDEAAPGDKEDLILRSLKLRGVGEDQHCRFVEPSGGCTIHAKHGISALPDICVDFPAHGFRDEASNTVELYWDPVCPEVVRMFTEETSPLALTTIGRPPLEAEVLETANAQPSGVLPAEMGWHDPGFAQRVSNAREELIAHVGGVRLTRAELDHVRTESLRPFEDRSRPTWESLAMVLAGFRELEPGKPLAFAARTPDDLDAFQTYLGGCTGAHGPPLLFWSLRKMERFVHAIDLKPLIADPRALMAGLESWGDALDQRYFPHEESLRPMYSRWMQHRFAMPYVNQEGELREAADTMALIFGTALRFAGGIAAALDRPVDPAISQAGISAAEYFYRTLQFAAETLPWYASVDTQSVKAARKAALQAKQEPPKS